MNEWGSVCSVGSWEVFFEDDDGMQLERVQLTLERRVGIKRGFKGGGEGWEHYNTTTHFSVSRLNGYLGCVVRGRRELS